MSLLHRLFLLNNNAITTCGVLFLAVALTSSGAFNSYIPRLQSDLNIHIAQTSSSNYPGHNKHDYKSNNHSRKSATTLHGSWLSDTFQSLGLDISLEKMKLNLVQKQDESTKKKKAGTVLRTAIKSYNKETSLPSHPSYTTRKESRGVIVVTPEGVVGDYNHYRTVAMSSTPDRAVSILTSDIVEMLRTAGWTDVMEGDLGENIYVDGIDYTFFEVGRRYKFQTNINNGNAKEEEGVVVEITERIEPCGNLCKLPYINKESLAPKDRFEECKKFLLYLDEKEGLRGWYGKVIDGGTVKVGDQVSALEIAAA
eukprot:scaffold24137_cov30-Cyclotella_meneghiniana.AAC.2